MANVPMEIKISTGVDVREGERGREIEKVRNTKAKGSLISSPIYPPKKRKMERERERE